MAKINPKRSWTTQKIDSNFAKELREIAKLRYVKNLEKKEPRLPEMTRLVYRQPEFKQILEKLKTYPRKEDLWKDSF